MPGMKREGRYRIVEVLESKGGESILSSSTESDKGILWAVPSLTPDRSLLTVSVR